MDKQKLVVIGNGMAGARAVEEVLARGGGDQFEITMFGDEPYGNYNRILLSNILSGSQDTSEMFINPLDWYTENNITLHAGSRVTDIDRMSQTVLSDTGIKLHYDKLLIATGSRAFIPPMDGLHRPDGGMKRGSSGSGRWMTAPRSLRNRSIAAGRWSSAAGCLGWKRRAGC